MALGKKVSHTKCEENLWADGEEMSSKKRDRLKNILGCDLNLVLMPFHVKVKFNIKHLETRLSRKNAACIFFKFLRLCYNIDRGL